MNRILAAVAAVLLASSAHGATFSKSTLCQLLAPCEPPPKYASGPFLKKPVVREVGLRQIQKICGGSYRAFLGDRAPSVMGCAKLERARCLVHVPRDVKAAVPELYAVILNHELAHCRGWVHRRY